jgi:hypothetical protein
MDIHKNEAVMLMIFFKYDAELKLAQVLLTEALCSLHVHIHCNAMS